MSDDLDFLEMEDAKPKTSRAKSTKVNFVLLKQILDNESSENTELEDQGSISEGSKGDQEDQSLEKAKKKNLDSFGPTGQYPVLFSKRCKSRSCQTKLSAFPLFSVPEDTEWISDGEENIKTKKSRSKSDDKKKRKCRESCESKTLTKNGKSQEMEREVKVEEKTKNPDGTRKDFNSEHQLKDSKNPVLLAWLHQKNKIARKIRKEDRKVKRAQRAALEEEERIRNERFEESDKKVSEWFKAKRKEARKAWRQNHPKISPLEMASDEPTKDSPPPPEYTVIKTFKSQRPWSPVKQRSGSACSSAKSFESKTCSSPVLTKLKGHHNVSKVKPKEVLTKEENNEVPKMTPVRPKTACARTPTRKTVPRPKTATTRTVTAPNEKQEVNKSATKMHNLNYDEWLKLKREQDKKSVHEKRRELIDAHLDAVIAKLGKQRVESIMSPRKRVDTGLKNYHRTAPKSAPVVKETSYKWVPKHKSPRPEPQGCDCPEAEHIDGKTSLVPSDSMVSASDPSSQGLPSPSTKKKPALLFCKEVTDKCDALKPSMDNVLAVLDAEIKKHKDRNTDLKIPHYKAPSGLSTANTTVRTDNSESGMNNLDIPGAVDPHVSPVRPKFSRPKSAKPFRPVLVSNTNLTVEEARKKILHDMDVLGLCEDSSEAGIVNDADQAFRMKNKSTVRSNYFDYGTDVDTPTMEK